MEKTVENVNVLDRQQKEMAEDINKFFVDIMKTRVDVNWYRVQDEDERGFEIYVYLNQFDYKKFNVKYIESAEPADYIEVIAHADQEGKLKLHKASAIEKMLIGALDGLKNLYIQDGEIYIDGECEGIWIDDIVNCNISTEDNILLLELTGEYFLTINLKTGEVSEVISKEDFKKFVEMAWNYASEVASLITKMNKSYIDAG